MECPFHLQTLSKRNGKVAKPKTVIILCLIIVAVCSVIYYFDELGIRDIPLEKLKAKYEKNESKYININGTDIHYCDQGQGPVIVALHGFVDSLHTWDGWVKAIGSHYRIIRMDIPGFGLTGPSSNGLYSKKVFVEFVDKFITALDVDKFIIAGNSLGGAIAWNYALQFPEKVEKMVLIDPAGYPMEIPWPLKLTAMPIIKNIAAMITPRFIYAMSLKKVLGDPKKVTDEMIDRHYELNLRPGNRKALLNIMEILKKHTTDPSFSKTITGISVPTMLLWGQKDSWIPVSHVSLWQRDLPDIRVIVYDGVGHIPQVEIPARSANDVHQWLSADQQQDSSAVKTNHLFVLKILSSILLLILGLYIVLKKKKV